jgi:hypothetical protein
MMIINDGGEVLHSVGAAEMRCSAYTATNKPLDLEEIFSLHTGNGGK